MNYRHAYHAGNHGDVLKHVALSRILLALGQKEKPFCFVDSHAGNGIYRLNGEEASKTREWEEGFGKLTEPISDAVEELLKPYREAVASACERFGALTYPGSPWIAHALSRQQDRLVLNELHPVDFGMLGETFRHIGKAIVRKEDARLFLKQALPPKERRGVVLIDPAYEEKDDAERALASLADAHKRFASGVLLLWYPVKGVTFADQFVATARALQLPEMLHIELRVREAFEGGGLAGSGIIAVNPP
ncbi:MAG: 23S rRNA (adenine(2030)-N(6))-methyltransferase RlmJ [Rhizobiales bacterium]|nr:23S rRNA (adenine(2030)-N(6))-methyltransferase RlmJ [Hyphomicrobiales bacterium]